MRSTLLLLAGLAGSSLAFPADVAFDRRGLGLISDLSSVVSTVTSDVTSVISTVLGAGQTSTLLTGLTPHGAAALEGGALGAKATSISAGARKELSAWLSSAQADLPSFLSTSLLSWCEGSVMVLPDDVLTALTVFTPMASELAAAKSLFVTVDGILSGSELESVLVITQSAQSSLLSFISGAGQLDSLVAQGLSVVANGGVVSSLTFEVKKALFGFLQSSNCPLTSTLQTTVLSWLQGQSGGDVVTLGSLGGLSQQALSLTSVASSLTSHIDKTGVLTSSGMGLVGSFLQVDICINIDNQIQIALQACAKGQSASSLPKDVQANLAAWLGGSSCNCNMGIELKSLLLMWMSFANSGASSSSSTGLIGGLVFDITTVSQSILTVLTPELRGLLSLISVGTSVSQVSFGTLAQLAALLGGTGSLPLGVSIETPLLQWLLGWHIPQPQCGPATSSPLPSSTPAPTTAPAVSTTPAPAPTPAPTSAPVVTVTVTRTTTVCPCDN